MPWRGFKLRWVTLRPGTFWRTLYQLSHRVEAFLWKVIAKGFVENVTLLLFSAIRFKHLAWCNWSEKRRKVEVGSFRWGTSFQSLRVWRTQRWHPWQLLGDAAGQRQLGRQRLRGNIGRPCLRKTKQKEWIARTALDNTKQIFVVRIMIWSNWNKSELEQLSDWKFWANIF